MTGLAMAVEKREWELAALYLLLGVLRSASRLPADAADYLLAELDTEFAEGWRPASREDGRG